MTLTGTFNQPSEVLYEYSSLTIPTHVTFTPAQPLHLAFVFLQSLPPSADAILQGVRWNFPNRVFHPVARLNRSFSSDNEEDAGNVKAALRAGGAQPTCREGSCCKAKIRPKASFLPLVLTKPSSKTLISGIRMKNVDRGTEGYLF
jgi:hypothetical protein